MCVCMSVHERERQHSLCISTFREQDQDSSCTHVCTHFLPHQSETAFLSGMFSGCLIRLGTETFSERPLWDRGHCLILPQHTGGEGARPPAAGILRVRGCVFSGNKDGTFLSHCMETQMNAVPHTHAHTEFFLSADVCACFPPWHALSRRRQHICPERMNFREAV